MYPSVRSAFTMRVGNCIFGIFFVLTTAYSEHDVLSFQCNSLESKSTTLRLKRFLFCDYDQSVRPTADHRNATPVRFELFPEYIQVDEQTNSIDLHCSIGVGWRDDHLKWDPTHYEDIKYIHVESYEVWTPDITSHTAKGSETNINALFTHCALWHDGSVHCVPGLVYTTACLADHTWWPYDTMNCTLQFGSWSHHNNDIQIRFIDGKRVGKLTLEKYEASKEWDLVRFYATERTELSKLDRDFSTNLMSYHFILKRFSSTYSSVYIVLLIVLIIMTLTTLWLEPKTTERMLVANINFICHLCCLMDIHARAPYNGSYTPKITLFCQYSLILATGSLILTSILRQIQEIKTDPPVWLSTSTVSVLRSKVGQILLISILDPRTSANIEMHADDNTDLMTSNKKESAWQYIAIVIGWIAFVFVLITYVVMIIKFLPTSTAGNAFILNA